MDNSEIDSFCIEMYTWALLQSEQKELNQAEYKKQIQGRLKKSRISFSKLRPFIHLSKAQWIEDLLEITRDVRLARQQFQQYRKKLQDRASMHFSNGHKQNLSKSISKNSSTKHVISMYDKSPSKQWISQETNIYCDKILTNTAYLIGLIKGNGVIVQKDYLVTCAHALIDEEENVMKYRCFVTGNGSFGIAKIQTHRIFKENDVGIAKIIRHFKSQNFPYLLCLTIPKALKFNSQFIPIRCLQVGLLFNNDPDDTFIKVFEPAQGFIERNLYKDQNDQRLIDEMGLLIHDCYGLWGTSGSPLWTEDGELIGIHNAWNQDGYNVSMIVHDDESARCRVVKQYERRAIGVHVLRNLFEQWKQIQFRAQKAGLEGSENPNKQSIRKKVKLS